MSTQFLRLHNVVNAAPSVRTSGGATSSGRREASKVVIQRKLHSLLRKSLVLHRKQGLRVCTLNTRTLNSTGAATLLDQELQRWNIEVAGLQEVRYVVGQWRGQHW